MPDDELPTVAPPSIFRANVDSLTPDPLTSSRNVNTIGCLLLPTKAPLAGDVIVMTGFVVSLTVSLADVSVAVFP
jgi:hypothetical protein